MSFPKYPDYKPSRLDTRAPLPSSWSEAPIKRAFDIVSGSTPKTDNEEFWDGETTWVTPADLSGLDAVDVTESKRTITEAGLLSCGTTLVPAGSIVISTRAPIGTLAIAGKELCTNQGCKALVPNGECSSRFAYYYLSACTEQLNIKGRGTTFLELSGDELGSFLMPKPAPVEQELICAFLDRETAKIDTLIAEQQRLIELLQEKRQAVISHAVTKGLNPNAPMKDSGVEWLGEVQEHWEVKPLKHLTRQISVGVVVEPSKYYDDQGTVPALRSLNIKAGEIQMDDCVYITEESNEILKKSRLCAGDLVVVRTGQPGTCAVIPDELDNCNCIDLIFIRKPRDGDSTYLMLSLSSESSRYQYAAGAEGAIQQHFNVKTASELVVPWPPEEEQSQIRDWLMRKTSDVDRLTSIAVQSIELLEERRSALISAAVTGQMDVRGLGNLWTNGS